jgi:hypothetical protein
MRAQTLADVGMELPPSRADEIDDHLPRCSVTRKTSRDTSWSVNTMDGSCCCHHCSWANALGLNGTSYGDPLRQSVESVSPPQPYTSLDAPPLHPSPLRILRWFANRGISEPAMLAICSCGKTYILNLHPARSRGAA